MQCKLYYLNKNVQPFHNRSAYYFITTIIRFEFIKKYLSLLKDMLPCICFCHTLIAYGCTLVHNIENEIVNFYENLFNVMRVSFYYAHASLMCSLF